MRIIPFMDREVELEVIRNALEAKEKGTNVLVLVYGRRRIGKTRLVEEALKNKDYFKVTFIRGSRKSQIISLSREISDKTGINVEFGDLSDAVKFIFKSFDIIFFDEFQNLWETWEEAPSILLKEMERKENRGKVLIISGSSSRLSTLLSQKEPLFGRQIAEIKLLPLKMKYVIELCKSLKVSWPEFASIFGGIPHYYAVLKFYEVKDVEEMVNKLICRPGAPFLYEGKHVLEFEFGRDWVTNFEILLEIGFAYSRASKIAHSLGKRITDLSKYFKTLVDKGILRREETPIGGRSYYEINDLFLRFWFGVVWKNIKFAEEGDWHALRLKVLELLPRAISFGFEEIAREAMKNVFKGYRIARQWGKHREYGPYEIDAAALSPDKKELILAEVKWQDKKIGRKELNELIEKAELLNFEGKIKYLLIGKKVEQIDEENVLTWDLNRLEQIFKTGKLY